MKTTAELASYLAVSEHTVRRWRQTGHGPKYVRYTRTGPCFYKEEDVSEWIGERTYKGTYSEEENPHPQI